MQRASKISFKWTNSGKQEKLNAFLDVYHAVVQDFVDAFWDMERVPLLLSKDVASLIDARGLSSRAMQAAGKQASGIVRGTKAKNARRRYVLAQLEAEGDIKGAERLRKAIERNPDGKPKCKSVSPALDSRFCKIDLESESSFEIWVTLASLGKPFGKLELPFQRNKHFNRMLGKGELKSSIRLSRKGITFIFDIPEPPEVDSGVTLGIDLGKTHTISASNGFQPGPNKHGHDLATIIPVISRRKKGSKGFERACAHRENYINWSINNLNLSGVRQVNREDLKNVGRGKRVPRSLSHWTYPAIIGKLESRCQELGVPVKTVDPAYTSQRCNRCGFTRKSSRKGSEFRCKACGHTANADLNAALNIALYLPSLGGEQRKVDSRTGFYWLPSGQERVVPVV